MHAFFSRAAGLGASCLAVYACSSSVDGSGAAAPTGFDVAVGAEVTLTFKSSGCDREKDPAARPPSSEGCLAERPKTLTSAKVTSTGPFTVLESKLERTGEISVRVRAERVGDTALVIEHADLRGQALEDTFVLRAREITDVEASVSCQWPEAPTHRYAITPASVVDVRLTAMSEATPLLSGALELVVDRGGLDLLDGPDRASRRVRVPSAPGTYTWAVAGTSSRPITFDVYDPAAVGIGLASTDRGITLRPTAAGAPVCVYEGDALATVSVVEGACRLRVGDYEVEGALPVTLGHGGATLPVVGTGGCTVEGRLKGAGGAQSVVVAPTDLRDPVARSGGDPIGDPPLERGGTLEKRGACRRVTKIGNDKCEAINAAGFVLPDGDCFSDWEWELDHRDDVGVFERGPVGVGLVSELRVSLEFSVLFIGVSSFSPNSLGFGAVPPPGIDIERLGCDGTKYEALGLRAKEAGLHKLGMVADNAPSARVYDIEARAVAKVSYLENAGEEIAGAPSRSNYFVASKVPIAVRYADAGNTTLRGMAPLRVAGSDVGAGATYRAGSIHTGTRPNKITLSSPVAAQTLVIDVVDATAITDIGGVTPQDVRKRGDERCVTPQPKRGAERIFGTAPERARLSFPGEGCAVRARPPWSPVAVTGEACFVPVSATPQVEVTWGATAKAGWSCGGP